MTWGEIIHDGGLSLRGTSVYGQLNRDPEVPMAVLGGGAVAGSGSPSMRLQGHPPGA